MAEYKFGDGIKKFFLAGVGAVAITAEKGQEIIGELVKKGPRMSWPRSKSRSRPFRISSQRDSRKQKMT